MLRERFAQEIGSTAVNTPHFPFDRYIGYVIISTVSRAARYPARHGIPRGTVSRTARYRTRQKQLGSHAVASGRYCQDELLAKAVGMQPLSWLIFVAALPLVGLATVTFSFASPLITLSLFVVLGWSLLALTCDVARSVVRIGEALHNVPHIGSAQSPEVPPLAALGS